MMHLALRLLLPWLFAWVTVLSPHPARANMRAPLMRDGDLIEGPRPPAICGELLLAQEVLTLSLPRLKQDAPLLRVKVVAEYTLDNRGAARELELIFFATDLGSPSVTVSGKIGAKPAIRPMTQAQLDEFWAKQQRSRKLSDREFKEWRSIRFPWNVAPVTARFKLALAQGTNVVRFSYDQEMLFWERGVRYGSARLDEGTSGLDYLLYPAKSWRMSPRFTLDVRVEVPDLLEEGWLWDDYRVPVLTSILPLTLAYSAKSRSSTYTGRFSGITEDILAVRVKWGEERD